MAPASKTGGNSRAEKKKQTLQMSFCETWLFHVQGCLACSAANLKANASQGPKTRCPKMAAGTVNSRARTEEQKQKWQHEAAGIGDEGDEAACREAQQETRFEDCWAQTAPAKAFVGEYPDLLLLAFCSSKCSMLRMRSQKQALSHVLQKARAFPRLM